MRARAGTVNPDEFYVFKPTLAQSFRPIPQKKLGTKEFKLVYEEGHTAKRAAFRFPAMIASASWSLTMTR